MNPRAMSVWIVAAASRAVSPFRSVQARVSLSPPVKNVISPTVSNRSREHGVEAHPPVSELGRFLGRQLGELGLELQVEAAVPAVDDADQRLRGEGLELGRKGSVVGAQGLACLDVGEDALELRDLVTQSRIAGFRLRADPLEPFFDVVAIRDDELELERLEIPVGVGLGPERRRAPRSARPPCEARRARPG